MGVQEMLHFLEIIKSFTHGSDVDKKTHKQTNHYKLLSDDTSPLPIAGQGTLYCRLKEHRPFVLDLIANNAIIRIAVSSHDVKLYCVYKGRFILLTTVQSPEAGLDANPKISYWISFHAKTRSIRYGKVTTKGMKCVLEYALPCSNKLPSQFWMNNISSYRVDRTAKIMAHPSVYGSEAA